MVAVLNFSRQMGATKCGHVILKSGHHPRVGFENQNNLCRDLWWEMYLGRRSFFNIPESEVFQYYRAKRTGRYGQPTRRASLGPLQRVRWN